MSVFVGTSSAEVLPETERAIFHPQVLLGLCGFEGTDLSERVSRAISIHVLDGDKAKRSNCPLVANPGGASGLSFRQGKCCSASVLSATNPEIMINTAAMIKITTEGFHILSL